MTRRLLAVLCGTALAFALTVHAGEPDKDPAKKTDNALDPKLVQDEAALQQDELRRRFDDFKAAMLRVAHRLEASAKKEDQDKAKQLKEAIDKASTQGIDGKFLTLIAALKDKDTLASINKLNSLEKTTKDLQKDIRLLIEMLVKDDRDKQLKEERERLQKLLEQLKAVIGNQERVRAQTEIGRLDKNEIKNQQEKVTDAAAKLANANRNGESNREKAEAKYGDKGDKYGRAEGKTDTEQKKGDTRGEGKPITEAKAPDTKPATESKPSPDKGDKPGAETKGDKSGMGEKASEGKGDDKSKPAEGKSGEANKEGKAGEQKSGEGKEGAKPSEAKSGESKEGGKPSEAKGGESKPGEGKSGESKSGEPKQGEGKSGEGKGGEPKPGDGKGGEAKGGEPKPGEGKGGEPKAGDGKSGEGKSGDGKPGEKKEETGNTKPASGKAGEGSKEPGKPSAPKSGAPKPGDGQANGKQSNKPPSAPSEAKGGAGKAGEPKSGSDSKGQGEGKGESKGSGKESAPPMGGSPSQGSQSKQGGGQAGQQGSQSKSGQQGQPGQQAQQPQDDNPVRKQVQEGNKYQKQAEKEIEKGKNEEASTKQDQAIKEFKQAQKTLEELLKQLREEEMERLLAKLQERCEYMLRQQIQVRDATKNIGKELGGKQIADLDQVLKDAVLKGTNKQQDAEKDIIKEATMAISLIQAEGSAIAFAEVFRGVRSDMQNVATRLGQPDVGEVTVAIENDIIAGLQDMVDALKKARQENKDANKQPPPPPGQKGPPQDPSLLNKIQELKLILSRQMRVNDRTVLYGKQYKGEQAVKPTETPMDAKERERLENVQRELQELAGQQKRIGKVTDDLYKGKNKAQGEQ